MFLKNLDVYPKKFHIRKGFFIYNCPSLKCGCRCCLEKDVQENSAFQERVDILEASQSILDYTLDLPNYIENTIKINMIRKL